MRDFKNTRTSEYLSKLNFHLVMNLSKRVRLPWLPGLQRPNFTFYRIRISIPTRVPPSFIFGLIYLSILYIYSGGVYDIVEKPYARGSDQKGNPVLLYTNQDRQFLIEGIVAGVIMFVGAFGLYFMNQATTDPHNPDRATSYQLMGLIMVAFAFLILQSMFNCKINGGC